MQLDVTSFLLQLLHEVTELVLLVMTNIWGQLQIFQLGKLADNLQDGAGQLHVDQGQLLQVPVELDQLLGGGRRACTLRILKDLLR